MNEGERLASLEAKLESLQDSINRMEAFLVKSQELSIGALEARVKILEDANQWLWRTIIGTILAGGIGIGYAILQSKIIGG